MRAADRTRGTRTSRQFVNACLLATAAGLDVQFGAFLAIILGLLIPSVFLVVL